MMSGQGKMCVSIGSFFHMLSDKHFQRERFSIFKMCSIINRVLDSLAGHYCERLRAVVILKE